MELSPASHPLDAGQKNTVNRIAFQHNPMVREPLSDARQPYDEALADANQTCDEAFRTLRSRTTNHCCSGSHRIHGNPGLAASGIIVAVSEASPLLSAICNSSRPRNSPFVSEWVMITVRIVAHSSAHQSSVFS
jgi:hypothetical protein